MPNILHVSKNGSDKADGSAERPFLTISRAASLAQPGDKVIVREGVYREWVKPQNGGRSDIERITYEAAKGERVVIKGSERVTGWEPYKGSAWKAVVPNALFGDYNPFAQALQGDWFVNPQDYKVHAGDVYLNGKSLYEAKSIDEVVNPTMRVSGFSPRWMLRPEPMADPEGTLLQWFATVGDENTTIYANFQGSDPNAELVEINVRKCCFYPEKTGLNYITVRGFEMAQAACPWTPPTADQPGLLGVNWAKGWIIENNIIHDAKCSGISIGKEASTGHNLCSRYHRKPGYQYQMEAVFLALRIGWSKETIGSHIIRNNTIYDCGQNGIVGHMGSAFCEIYGNHIYNIAVKHEFFGYEIAGIKLHAAIDVQIIRNRVHDCTLGVWLDWQAQGARVGGNLFYRNTRDLMIEVTHGPYLVDNNIFASGYNFDNIAQGGAYVHNLCCGSTRREPVLNRATPYHFPHSTNVAGTALVYGGDDRLYNNIFIGGVERKTIEDQWGTSDYDGSPASLEEYAQRVIGLGVGDIAIFEQVTQSAYIDGNAYLRGAKAFNGEKNNFMSDVDPVCEIFEKGDEVYLKMSVERGMLLMGTSPVSTGTLGSPRIAEGLYENPDGTPIALDRDYLSQPRGNKPLCGPLECLVEGENLIKVWG